MHVTALHRVQRGAVILGDQIAPVIDQARRARDRCAERHDDRHVHSPVVDQRPPGVERRLPQAADQVVERRVQLRRSGRAQAIVAVVGVCPRPVAGEIGLGIIRERAAADRGVLVQSVGRVGRVQVDPRPRMAAVVPGVADDLAGRVAGVTESDVAAADEGVRQAAQRAWVVDVEGACRDVKGASFIALREPVRNFVCEA